MNNASIGDTIYTLREYNLGNGAHYPKNSAVKIIDIEYSVDFSYIIVQFSDGFRKEIPSYHLAFPPKRSILKRHKLTKLFR